MIVQDVVGRVWFECDKHDQDAHPEGFIREAAFAIEYLPDHLLADFVRMVERGDRASGPLSNLNHLLPARDGKDRKCSAQLGRDSIKCPRKAVFVEQTRLGLVLLMCADHADSGVNGGEVFPISQVGSEHWPILEEMIGKGESVRFDVIKELRP